MHLAELKAITCPHILIRLSDEKLGIIDVKEDPAGIFVPGEKALRYLPLIKIKHISRGVCEEKKCI